MPRKNIKILIPYGEQSIKQINGDISINEVKEKLTDDLIANSTKLLL